jgi:hypothetical protein
MADDWITTQQAVKLSGYHQEHLRALIRQKRIKARKYFVIWQVNRSSLLAYLREQSQKGEKRGRKPLS